MAHITRPTEARSRKSCSLSCTNLSPGAVTMVINDTLHSSDSYTGTFEHFLAVQTPEHFG